jgi:hypothetical protein
MKEIIKTQNAPATIGSYSQAAKLLQLLTVSRREVFSPLSSYSRKILMK